MNTYYENKFNKNKSSMLSCIFEGIKETTLHKTNVLKEKKAIETKVKDLTNCYETMIKTIEKNTTALTDIKSELGLNIINIKKYLITDNKYNVVMLHELDDRFKAMLKLNDHISKRLKISSCLDKSCNYSCGYDYEFYDLDNDDYQHELDIDNGYFVYEIINDNGEIYCFDEDMFEQGLETLGRLEHMQLRQGKIMF